MGFKLMKPIFLPIPYLTVNELKKEMLNPSRMLETGPTAAGLRRALYYLLKEMPF